MAGKRTEVGLFVTCLVDLFRPEVGFATIRLLESRGFRVRVPGTQTCCGQVAYNNGDLVNARRLALQIIDTYADYPWVVAPSGSCAGQLRKLPQLFKDNPECLEKAENLASRSMELTMFLTEVAKAEVASASPVPAVTYHDSCAGLRELDIREQPRKLLQEAGIPIIEMHDAEVCCGFGGTFCVKYPDIADGMVKRKIACAQKTRAPTLTGGDLGCLLHISGSLSRQGEPLKVRHIAEILADRVDSPNSSPGQSRP